MNKIKHFLNKFRSKEELFKIKSVFIKSRKIYRVRLWYQEMPKLFLKRQDFAVRKLRKEQSFLAAVEWLATT